MPFEIDDRTSVEGPSSVCDGGGRDPARVDMADRAVLHPLMAGRRSVSIFNPTHMLSDGALDSLLTAAQWAPSAGNSQPWAFVVCRRGDANHERFVPLLSRGNSGWVPKASAVFVTLCRTASGPEPDAPIYSDYAEYDLGQSVAHLTMQARAIGLDTHQFAGFDHAAVADRFNVPADFKVMTGVAVGLKASAAAWAAAEEHLQQREHRGGSRRPLKLF